jgi:hypothetical protein
MQWQYPLSSKLFTEQGMSARLLAVENESVLATAFGSLRAFALTARSSKKSYMGNNSSTLIRVPEKAGSGA